MNRAAAHSRRPQHRRGDRWLERTHTDQASPGVRVWSSVLSRIVAAAGLASRSRTPFPSPDRDSVPLAGRRRSWLSSEVQTTSHKEGSDEHSVQLTGRLTRDPELVSLDSGSVCRMRLAVENMGRNETGYVDVSTFGKPGEAAARVLSQGLARRRRRPPRLPPLGRRRRRQPLRHRRGRQRRVPRRPTAPRRRPSSTPRRKAATAGPPPGGPALPPTHLNDDESQHLLRTPHSYHRRAQRSTRGALADDAQRAHRRHAPR